MQVKVKKPLGRPTKYNPKTTPQIVKDYAAKGMINREIAKRIGINVCTLYEWFNLYSDLANTIEEARRPVDEEIERSTFQRAKGYNYTEVTKERNSDGKMVITKKVKKHIPAEPSLNRFWLKNRKPDIWQERTEITGPKGGPIGIVFIPDKITPEEWLKNANSNTTEGTSVEPAAETDAGTEVSG